jgi:intracellular multiplication protein IcmK
LKQVLFGLLGLVIVSVATADTAVTTSAPAPAPAPGSTVTTITTTTTPTVSASSIPTPGAVARDLAAASPVVATSAAPAAAIPGTATAPVNPGVATSAAPAPTLAPGTIAAPPSLNDPAAQQSAGTGGAGAPQGHLVDPSLFGTLQDPAFQNMTGKMFPMTADQIRAFRDVYEATKRITAEPARIPPRPLVSSQTISLAPGTVPPVIRLANGYVSSVVFVDETGAPWPVASYSVGNPQAFNIQWDTESNILMIQGQGAYVTGNMAVTLAKLSTPIMLTIVSEQNVVDYRLDFRVQGRGPNANGSIIGSSLPQNSNQMLMNLLDGVPPGDARALEVTGGPAEAWVREGSMFVRTPLTVLSPSWTATMSSPDGTKVYQMNPTPMVLVSDRGQSVVLKVKGL